MVSGPSIVLLILFLVELAEWHQTRLLKSKCLPILYYGIEACPLCKSQFKSLDFVINSAIRGKSFDTKFQDIVDTCRDIFNCLPAESVIANHIC